MGEGNAVKYVIVGGGAAAANAAVGIRELDQAGSVLILGKEKWWPYDRPPLSKGMLLGKVTPEDAESKDPSWYEKNNVQVRRDTPVKSIDRTSKTVVTESGESFQYERLLIATGATPKPAPVEGADLEGVHLFRTVDDSLAVRKSFETAKEAVFIGTGYIGLEVGSAALTQGLNVTFVDPTEHPWAKNTSSMTGFFLKRAFEAKGAKFYQGKEVAKITGEGRVTGVVLKSGEVIPADVVVVGIGVTLNTDLAKACGLTVDEKNGVSVDAKLRTEDPDVYVAGDIAYFDDVSIGRKWHAEHFLSARWQGKQAGRNMAGADETYNRVPYFFSDFLDLHMALRGDPQGGKSIGAVGEPETGDYVELYAREDGTLAMGLAISHSEPTVDKASEILEKLISERAVARELSSSTFGLDQDEGLG
jgi:3-phenylpropionate/trans-cinnamate dioxygenase ferredoxin reductase subunit